MIKLYLSLIWIMFLLFTSCKENHISIQKHETKKYYLSYSFRRHTTDTLEYNQINKDIHHFKEYDSITLDFQRHYVKIKKLSNWQVAPADGEELVYWENNVGVFYYRSLSWDSFYILQTNDDSINNYIKGLLGIVLMNNKMYLTPSEQKLMYKFIPPIKN